MSLATYPPSHRRLAHVFVSDTVGRSPEQCHAIDVVVSRRDSCYRCEVVEVWGTEGCRCTVVGHGASLLDAFRQVVTRAHDAGTDTGLLAKAISHARDEALEALKDLPMSTPTLISVEFPSGLTELLPADTPLFVESWADAHKPRDDDSGLRLADDLVPAGTLGNPNWIIHDRVFAPTVPFTYYIASEYSTAQQIAILG